MTSAHPEDVNSLGRPRPKIVREFHTGHIAAGDIIFTCDTSPKLSERFENVFNFCGQRLLAALRRHDRIPLSERIPKYTHVMLGLDGGLVIHADGNRVSIDVISDALQHDSDKPITFRIFRPHHLNVEIAAKIARAAVRYYEQRYRFRSYFAALPENKAPYGAEPKDLTQFCSRLVSHSYRSAGSPLSQLPDHRVLPIDLYRICQTSDWTDVTSEFIHEYEPESLDSTLGSIHVPGLGEVSMSEYFERTDKIIYESAKIAKESEALKYKSLRDALHTEGLLAQLANARFDLAKGIRLQPNLIDDDYAEQTTRILQQLGALLDLCLLPQLDQLQQPTLLNASQTKETLSIYAGFPPPQAMLEMQKARNKIIIYTYLLMAETALLGIIAHSAPDKNLEAFRRIDPKHISKFLLGVPQIEDLTPFENNDSLCAWVEDKADREQSVALVGHIVAGLKFIDLITRREN